jgi:hydrogenase maturation protein HypF
MVRTARDARRLGVVGPCEERLLTHAERPIVLLETVPASPVAWSVARGLNTIGVLTAYTPLHHLLLACVERPLVMTSGNLTEEPIVASNDEARTKLAHVADGLLLHDREITSRSDDSVVRVAGGAPIVLRRARGYAPLPLRLPIPAPTPLVALGAHLKNTFTLAADADAYVSQHLGDLENLATLRHCRATLDAYARLFRIRPAACARDMHPGYLTSRVAEDLRLEQVVPVQHHHAHVAAVAAEHGVTDSVIGVAFDGAGYGDDGAVWGAEFLVADLLTYERMGHLRYAPLPGGDLAARQPWRAAMGYLWLEPDLLEVLEGGFSGVDAEEQALVRQQLDRRLNAPNASSMGRLFDAAAAILGVRMVSSYEGHAAMELEAAAGTRLADPLPFPIVEDDSGGWILDPVPLLKALDEQRSRGEDVAALSARFHASVAHTSVALVARIREQTGVGTVALGGGVFQNGRLFTTIRTLLRDAGMQVLTPRALSPNDGAISYGQAAVAAAHLAERE